MLKNALVCSSGVIILIAFFTVKSYSDNFIINSIKITGNIRTKDFIISQELLFKQNDVLSEEVFTNSLSNSIQNIRNLGIFSEVDINYSTNFSYFQSNQSGIPIDIIVKTEDKWTLFPVPYYYYDNKDGNSFTFILIEGNLFGLNQGLEFQGNYMTGPDLKSFSIDYEYPRILGSYYYLKLSLSYLDFLDAQYNDNYMVYRSRSINYINTIQLLKKFHVFETDLSPFINSSLNYITNIVELNTNSIIPANGLLWYIGPGIEQGTLNRNIGEVWGDNNSVWLGISPNDLSLHAELKQSKFFNLGNKSVFGYSLNGLISPAVNQPLDSDNIRGIKLGEVRGNFIIYGNIEWRPYLFTISWPTPLDFYTPVFLDFGNGITNGGNFDFLKTAATPGVGLRFYPKNFGGGGSVIRFDIGVNMTDLLNGLPFGDYFFFAFDFKEEF